MGEAIKTLELKPFYYNSDIAAIVKKSKTQSISPLEASLLRHKGLTESKIQEQCRRIFLSLFPKGKFVQIDNGGHGSAFMRMKKGREGTVTGMKDVMLIRKGKIAFVEFKKIDFPSEIEPSDQQKEIHNYLLECGFDAYYCNNILYFEQVICEEFKK